MTGGGAMTGNGNPNGVAAIRADLARRIGAIEWRAGPRRVAAEVDTIRSIASRHAMLPAVTVAQLLERALARGEHGPSVHHWLGVLSEAVQSERQDAGASEVFSALCHTRFAA